MSASYADFLADRRQLGGNHGFEASWLPDWLFDFQRELVSWQCRKGRGAIFADCGLGKTPMLLVWAENVVRHTGGNVLVLSPLAVSAQTEREAAKFGIRATRSQGEVHPGITLTNYEQLEHFDSSDFIGVVCDESSILKNYAGKTRGAITRFVRKMPYRLLDTATAAPNDFIELGTSSEALGYLGHMDMLNRFFVNDQNNSATGRVHGEQVKWRLKGHAELAFWRWVCSWSRAVRRPSDLGYSDERFELPPLTEHEHVIAVDRPLDGMLFALPAVTLQEQRAERRASIEDRAARVAELVNNTGQPALVWCHLNAEGDALERAIPDAVQVTGSEPPERKESKLMDFADGNSRVLVTKPKIGGWGLNFQHCAHVTFFPSHSFEQYYQGVRRCWRFGQTRPVRVDIVTTDGEQRVLANLRRKADQADDMFERLVGEMNNALSIDGARSHTVTPEIPSWLS